MSELKPGSPRLVALRELAADADLERRDFLYEATEQLRRFLEANRERLRENMGALEHPLSAEQLAELDRLFPPPDGPRPLEML